MFEGLARIFELIKEWLGYLIPFHVLGDDECGLVRRFGQYHRDMRHGVNWHWPLGIEIAMSEVAALDSTVLAEQTLTTKDGDSLTVRFVLGYRVINPKKYILECATAESVLNDVGLGVIGEVVPRYTTAEIMYSEADFSSELRKKVRARARAWGVEVVSIGLSDCVKASAVRLIVNGALDTGGQQG